MNEPTKQEVMEALHIHSTDGDCRLCPYQGPACTRRLTEDALALLESEENSAKFRDALVDFYQDLCRKQSDLIRELIDALKKAKGVKD